MRDTKRHPRHTLSGATRHRDAGEAAAPGDATGHRARGERGFALLVSLIAIVGLTALATGGFFLADSEHKTSDNHHASVEAFHLAEAGLNQYLGTASGTPSLGWHDPYEYPDVDGEAAIRVERVGTTQDDQALYQVTSEGRYRPDAPNPVTRQVGVVTMLNTGAIPDPEASVTSGGGIRKNGNSGLISGFDNCNSDSDRAGVRVPDDPGYDGKDKPVEGDPPVESVSNPFDFLEPGAEAWWDGMLDGTTVPHDHVLGSDTNSSHWPDFSEIPDDEMPVTYVDKSNVDLGDAQDGQGLLIVRGDATLKGNFDWDGIVLVGGSVTDNGQGQIRGAVMTGLNVLKGQDVGQDDLEDVDTLNGTKKYLFDSCIVQQVQDATATLANVPSTWHEQI